MGNVIDAMSRTGMYIISAKVQIPAKKQMEEFYATHKGKPFFDELVDFMSGKKSLALSLRRRSCQKRNQRSGADGCARCLFGFQNGKHGPYLGERNGFSP